jgi:hypothetical protein
MIASQAGGNVHATFEGHCGIRSATLESHTGGAGQYLKPLGGKGYSQIGGDLILRNRLLALLGPTCGASQYARAHKEHLCESIYASQFSYLLNCQSDGGGVRKRTRGYGHSH